MMVQPVKLYVGNVPTSARNSELKELFEKFGKVVECDILKEFGFVHMEDTNDAKAAIAGLNDTLWKGARVRVELSTTKTNKGEPSHRYKNYDDPGLDRQRRQRSNDRDRDRGRNYNHHNSFSSSRGGGPDPYYRDERPPYDRYGNQGGPLPSHHRYPAKNDLGPIRDSRYGSRPNGYMSSERGRPYPDAYDRNGGGAAASSGRMYPPGGYGGSYPPPPPPHYGRSGSPHEHYSRDRNLDYSDPYMRPPPIGHHYPPLNQGYPYRAGPVIPRYEYDHPSNYGVSASSSRGSRYHSPPSSSSKHIGYKSHNGSSPHRSGYSNDLASSLNSNSNYANGRHHGSPSNPRSSHHNGSSSTKRRHQSSSPRPKSSSTTITTNNNSKSSHIRKEQVVNSTKAKAATSSRSSSSNLNSGGGHRNGHIKKSSNTNRSDSHTSSSPSSSSNSSSPSFHQNDIKSSNSNHQSSSSDHHHRQSRRRKTDRDLKKEKSLSNSPVSKKKSSSPHRSRSNSNSRSRSSKRSNRY